MKEKVMENKVIKNVCTNCEKETEMEVVVREQTIEVKKDSITVPVHYLRCRECKDEVLSPTHGEDPFDLAYTQYRKKHGLLSPEEIRTYRKSLGITQTEFAKLLGLGLATINRYENGALQEVSHDKFMRLAMNPHNILKLLEKSENIFEESRKKVLIQSIIDVQKTKFSLERAIELILNQDEPNLFNGFTKTNTTKIFNTILFLCKEAVWKTKLNKLLFYIDFKHFKEYTLPITGMKYVHLPFGPCPDNYDVILAWLTSEKALIKNETIFESGDCGESFKSNKNPDLSIFTLSELDTLGYITTYFKDYSANRIKDFSHDEEGYKATEQGEYISYDYAKSLRV